MRQRVRTDKKAGRPVPTAAKTASEERAEDLERVRVTLTFDRSQLAQVDRVAARSGVTRTAVINLCVTVGLPILMRTLSAPDNPPPEAAQDE